MTSGAHFCPAHYRLTIGFMDQADKTKWNALTAGVTLAMSPVGRSSRYQLTSHKRTPEEMPLATGVPLKS
jgi:hypothetical protein